jgi:formylmethanofuran dehydrogenase subunit B
MNEQAVLEQTNHSLARWRELLGELLSSRYGAILSGSATDPQSHPEFDIAGEQLAWLVRALNDTNRFVTLEMRTDHNALGAENVLSWNSGFGENVNLNRGYPRSCFSEYSAATVLEEKSCDLIVLGSLIRAGEALSKLSANAAQQFMQTPKILLNETGVEPAFQPQVEFRVLRPGGAALGDFCRLDDVAIPMSVLWQQDHLPSAKNILEWLV